MDINVGVDTCNLSLVETDGIMVLSPDRDLSVNLTTGVKKYILCIKSNYVGHVTLDISQGGIGAIEAYKKIK